jgi:hypothetical protein
MNGMGTMTEKTRSEIVVKDEGAMLRRLLLSAAMLASSAIALTPVATGQPEPSLQYAPSGDVWMTSGEAHFFPRGGDIARTPQLPTGDVWPAPDDAIRTAQPAATRDTSSARAGDASASRSISVAPK